MKIYKIIGTRINTSNVMLPMRTTDDVFVSEGMEIYVLVESFRPNSGLWTMPDGTAVDLYNVHATGETRWIEPFMSYKALSPAAFGAVKHFKLTPYGVEESEWREVFVSYEVNPSELSELKIEMLRRAKGSPDRLSFYKHETGKPHPGDDSAMYEMVRKGLVLKDCSHYSNGVETQYFKITADGLKVLEAIDNHV